MNAITKTTSNSDIPIDPDIVAVPSRSAERSPVSMANGDPPARAVALVLRRAQIAMIQICRNLRRPL